MIYSKIILYNIVDAVSKKIYLFALKLILEVYGSSAKRVLVAEPKDVRIVAHDPTDGVAHIIFFYVGADANRAQMVSDGVFYVVI